MTYCKRCGAEMVSATYRGQCQTCDPPFDAQHAHPLPAEMRQGWSGAIQHAKSVMAAAEEARGATYPLQEETLPAGGDVAALRAENERLKEAIDKAIRYLSSHQAYDKDVLGLLRRVREAAGE